MLEYPWNPDSPSIIHQKWHYRYWFLHRPHSMHVANANRVSFTHSFKPQPQHNANENVRASSPRPQLIAWPSLIRGALIQLTIMPTNKPPHALPRISISPPATHHPGGSDRHFSATKWDAKHFKWKASHPPSLQCCCYCWERCYCVARAGACTSSSSLGALEGFKGMNRFSRRFPTALAISSWTQTNKLTNIALRVQSTAGWG